MDRKTGDSIQYLPVDSMQTSLHSYFANQSAKSCSGVHDLADAKAALQAFMDHRGAVESGKGAVPTGFAPLDAILGGGMLRSGLYILATRPGMGKITVALQFADSIAANVGSVLFVSLEMSLAQLEGKRIARLSGIPSDEVLLSNEKALNCKKRCAAWRLTRRVPPAQPRGLAGDNDAAGLAEAV